MAFRLTRCRGCRWFVPAGAPDCAACVEWIDADIEAAWQAQRRQLGVADEPGLALAVLADIPSVPWRVVEAAMHRVPCATCAQPTGAGPATCDDCRLANGNRFGAKEPDRPHVPRGNEHAIHVSTVVARWPQWFPAHMVPLYASTLALLHAGDLPTTAQAQATKAWANRGGDVRALPPATSFAEAAELIAKTPNR